MFPTPVGMNHEYLSKQGYLKRVPHTRGDEPGYTV